MDHLFLLQFACFLFMLFNAFTLAVTRLQARWLNPRYERARWLIFVGIMGLAAHYLMQMRYGFRAVDDAVGATVNALVYAPCFSLISMGIFHIEATHVRRRRVYAVCAAINLAIFACFFIGCFHYGSMRIGAWLYAMQALFAANVVYCIVVIVREIIKRRRLLETMAGGDIMPYVRYSRASLLIIFFPALVSPFAIISTKLLLLFCASGAHGFPLFHPEFRGPGLQLSAEGVAARRRGGGKGQPCCHSRSAGEDGSAAGRRGSWCRFSWCRFSWRGGSMRWGSCWHNSCQWGSYQRVSYPCVSCWHNP